MESFHTPPARSPLDRWLSPVDEAGRAGRDGEGRSRGEVFRKTPLPHGRRRVQFGCLWHGSICFPHAFKEFKAVLTLCKLL